MIVFVTGGTGFIGSHLCDALLADPEVTEVRCLVRSDLKWLRGKKIVPVKGNLHDLNELSAALKGVDVLYHLAGMVMAPEYDTLHQANVEGTQNILLLAKKQGVKKAVVLSSLAAVGPSNGTPLKEDAPLRPVSNYGRSKKNMELMIKELNLGDLQLSIIRPPAVFGPREDQIYSFFNSASKGFAPVIGNGREPLVSMVYVKDLVRAILLSTDIDFEGIKTFFITGQHDYSWNEIAEATSLALRKKVHVIRIKPSLITRFGALSEDLMRILGKYPVVNREKAQELVLEWRCSSLKARDELNYTAQFSLEFAIAETIGWYKLHHWI